MREALGSWHMGRVLKAYRTHPWHAKPVPQETVGHWIGLTQAQLSRIENGPAPQELDKLMRWAHVLGVPGDLLWFKLPAHRYENTDRRAARKEEPPDMEAMERRAFLARGIAVTVLPALTVDDLRHLAAALENAHRYADAHLTQVLRNQLTSLALDDGSRGAKKALPPVLGILTAIESMSRSAKGPARQEILAVGSTAAEFAGWLYRDAGMTETSEHWRDRAVDWAREACAAPLQGYAMLRKSQGCWDNRDARRMGELARAAQHRAWRLPDRVRAEALQQEAQSMAMLGEPLRSVEGKLDAAREVLADVTATDDGAAESEPRSGYSMATLDLQTAICLAEAGQPMRAVELYERCLAQNTLSYRDSGYFTSLMAASLAEAGEPAEAATAGATALRVAEATASGRTVRELVRLSVRLTPWAGLAAVRELRDAVYSGTSGPASRRRGATEASRPAQG